MTHFSFSENTILKKFALSVVNERLKNFNKGL